MNETPENPDLYRKLICLDCGKCFTIPGSTPVAKIVCPKCEGTDWDNYEDYWKRNQPGRMRFPDNDFPLG